MFKRAQVLRTTRAVNAVNGEPLPAGTRVVVLKQEENGSWRVKVQDDALDRLRGVRAVVGESRLGLTQRGRPRKEPVIKSPKATKTPKAPATESEVPAAEA